MQLERPSTQISVETSAPADLHEVCRWLIDCQLNPVRLDVHDVPALGQGARLRLALPVTAARAVLCGVWLLEDVDAGECLLAGQLRFVAHPTAPDIRLSFYGRTASALSSGLRRHADHAASQLLDAIAELIKRPIARPGPTLA